jgi:hypothetical protein
LEKYNDKDTSMKVEDALKEIAEAALATCKI